MADLGEEAEAVIARGVGEAIGDQVGAGIDIPTDGEIARENYIHYHCRHLEGVSFERLEEKALRNDAYRAWLPAIVGPLSAGAPFLPADYRRARAFTDRPVKITMPGPMTIADTTVDLHYGDPRALGRDSGHRPEPGGARPGRRRVAGTSRSTSHCSHASPMQRSTTDSNTWNGHSTAAPRTSRAPFTCAAAIRPPRSAGLPEGGSRQLLPAGRCGRRRRNRRRQHRGCPSSERPVVAGALSPNDRDPRGGRDSPEPGREQRGDSRFDSARPWATSTRIG